VLALLSRAIGDRTESARLGQPEDAVDDLLHRLARDLFAEFQQWMWPMRAYRSQVS